MALEILSDPFRSTANTALDENVIRNAAPSLPDTKVQDLIRAAENEAWDKQEGVNEKFMLDKELTSIASYISAELGPFALDLYEQAQPLIAAGVLRLINEGDRTGSFRGQNARGGSQWDIQQVTSASLEDTSNFPNAAAAAAGRVYSTGQVGAFNIAPKVDPTGPNIDTSPGAPTGSNQDGTHTLDTDTQSVFILGMYSATNPRVVEQAVIDVDDGESRQAFDIYGHQNLGTLQVQDGPSVEYLTDDDSFDINGSATQNAATDLYPFGVDLNTAAGLPSLQTQV